jgi:general stress protein YciG
MTVPRKRGFAAMNQEQQRAIASKGGRAAHRKGTAHEFSSEEARKAGYLGGKAVSANRQHMAAIGRKGGQRARGRIDPQRNVQSLDQNRMSTDVPATLSFDEY